MLAYRALKGDSNHVKLQEHFGNMFSCTVVVYSGNGSSSLLFLNASKTLLLSKLPKIYQLLLLCQASDFLVSSTV